MKHLSYCICLISAFSIVQGSVSPPCGSEADRNLITIFMTEGINNFKTAGELIGVNCPAAFECAGLEFGTINRSLQLALNYFLPAYFKYDDILGRSRSEPICTFPQPVCDCTVLNASFAEVIDSYNTQYAGLWAQYTGSGTENCTDLAIQLQALVGQYYCTTRRINSDYFKCVNDNCFTRCISVADRANFQLAFTLAEQAVEQVTQVAGSLGNECQDGSFICVTADVEAIVGTLNRTEIDLQSALNIYNVLLGDTGYNVVCLSPVAECNCTKEIEVLDSVVLSFNSAYKETYDSLLYGIAEDCTVSLTALRDLTATYICATRNVRDDYLVCLQGCSDLQSEIQTTIEAAIALVEEVSDDVQSLCTDQDNFCSTLSTSAIVTSLEAAAQGFNKTFQLYNQYLGDTFQFGCFDVPVDCRCSILEDTTEALLGSYDTSYTPLWDQFIDGDQTVVQRLQILVVRYYCIVQTILKSIEECESDCTACVTPDDQSFIDNTEANMTSAFEALKRFDDALEKQCRSSSLICTASNFTLALEDLDSAASAFEKALQGYNLFLGDTTYVLVCNNTIATCDCDSMSSAVSSLFRSYGEVYEPLWEEVTSGGTLPDCNDAVTALRDLVAGYVCMTRQLMEDYRVCQERCEECNVLVCTSGARLGATRTLDPVRFLGGLLRPKEVQQAE